jgi:mannose-6-phosphate isomerase-like protein (cupin superfamily)
VPTISPDQGERADFPGLGTTYMLRGEDTDGQFALVEHTIPPRTLAAPTHVHEREDEFSYVLAGRVGVLIGDEVTEAGPGELVAKPRGVPHAFWNAGDEQARLLELISPPAFASYFAEMAPVLSADGPPEFEQLNAIRQKYALSMDPESREALKSEHGLER